MVACGAATLQVSTIVGASDRRIWTEEKLYNNQQLDVAKGDLYCGINMLQPPDSNVADQSEHRLGLEEHMRLEVNRTAQHKLSQRKHQLPSSRQLPKTIATIL